MMRGGLLRVLAPLPRLPVTPHLSTSPLSLSPSPLHLSPSSRHFSPSPSPRHLSTSPRLAGPGPAFSTLGELGHPSIDPAVLTTTTTAAMKEHLAKHGDLNPALPASHQLEVAEVLALAESLAAVVTRAAAAGEWGELEGLVEDSCLRRLTSAMEAMPEDQRSLITLNPDDVLMSFISNADDCSEGNDLNVVIFSYPGLHKITGVLDLFQQEILRQRPAPNIKESEFIKICEEVKKESGVDIVGILDGNEAVIGNYRLGRAGHGHKFRLSEMGQISLGDPRMAGVRRTVRELLEASIKVNKPFLEVMRLYLQTSRLSRRLGLGLLALLASSASIYLLAR